MSPGTYAVSARPDGTYPVRLPNPDCAVTGTTCVTAVTRNRTVDFVGRDTTTEPTPPQDPTTTTAPDVPVTPTPTTATQPTGPSVTGPAASGTSTVPAPGAGPAVTAPTPTHPGASVGALRLAIVVTHRRLHATLKHGLAVRPGCTATCRVTVRLSIDGGLARRAGLLKRSGYATTATVGLLRASGVTPTTKLTVLLTRAARRALADERTLRVRVTVTAATAKNRTSRTRTVLLKR